VQSACVVWWWGGVVDRRLKECVWKLLAGELSKCRVVEGEKNEWLSGGDEVNEGFLENVRRVKSGESNSERRFTAEAQIALVRFLDRCGQTIDDRNCVFGNSKTSFNRRWAREEALLNTPSLAGPPPTCKIPLHISLPLSCKRADQLCFSLPVTCERTTQS